jgi:hypothetical protein
MIIKEGYKFAVNKWNSSGIFTGFSNHHTFEEAFNSFVVAYGYKTYSKIEIGQYGRGTIIRANNNEITLIDNVV